MMHRIKALLLSFFLLIVVAGVLLFLSIRSEENHLENCKSLGVSCETGRIQQMTQEIWAKIQPLLPKK